MTVAVDIQTGKVIGQFVPRTESQRDGSSGWIQILTRDGYKHVPRASVRVEKV